MSLVRRPLDIVQLARTSLPMMAFLLAVFLGSVNAEVGYYCVDGNSYRNWTLDGELHNITEPCKYGCIDSSGICENEPVDSGVTMIAVVCILMIAGIMAYMAMNIDRKEHGAIQMFFIFISMVLQYASMGVVQSSMVVLGITSYSPLVNTIHMVYFWVIFFLLFYISAGFLFNLVNVVKRRKYMRKDGLGGDQSL